MLTTDLPPDECPHCHAPTECVSSVDGKTPTPGMLVVCIECTGVAVFCDDLRLRKAEPWELMGMPPDNLDTLRRHQKAVAQFRAWRKGLSV